MTGKFKKKNEKGKEERGFFFWDKKGRVPARILQKGRKIDKLMRELVLRRLNSYGREKKKEKKKKKKLRSVMIIS